MRSPRILSLAVLSLLALFALPSVAQGPGKPRLINAVYLGNGRILDAAPPQQLSLNAHVGEFAYQPGGLEIAYAGSEGHNARGTGFIKLVGVRHGETITLLSKPVDFLAQAAAHGVPQAEIEEQTQEAQAAGVDVIPPSPFKLYGWSADGRYLLVKDVSDTDEAPSAPAFLRVDVGASPVHVTSIALPMPAKDEPGFTFVHWSPQHTRVLFTRPSYPVGQNGKRVLTTTCFLYDPARDRVEASTLPQGQRVLGWRDEGHWLLQETQPGKTQYLSYDPATGQAAVIPKPAKLPSYTGRPEGESADTSPTAPYLRLDTQPHQIVDAKKVSAVDATALWVRRTRGPAAMSAVSVGLTPGPASPQAVWSPTGNQVAYLAHGDLFVTDLIVRPATTREKVAAGEKLSCPEERELAMSNLKQIGLGLLMYCQDYDERYPSAENVNDKIGPYIKDSDIFGFGSNQFVYRPPSDLALAKIASPAETVIGTYDVPCAHIVLYADGHVKQFPRQGYEP